MKRLKLYEPDDKMIDIISDNYSMLQGLNAFGIRLGFGDKSVEEVCHEQDVDCYTFLAVVNYIINDYAPKGNDDRICAKTLLAYLRASHRYFLDYQLPGIRKKLEDALLPGGDLTTLILRLYDEYSRDIHLHMRYEEKTLFPYVEALMAGEPKSNYNVEMFAKYHSDTTAKLQELKNIIIKYLPHDDLSNNQLTTTLFDIYNIEEWLSNHSNVEEMIFVPAIRLLEKRVKSNDTSSRIYQILNGAESNETITEREKEIIVCLVQGMINKVIADKLNISVNTVITHRRNISRKLQIHSLAGLTLYAIANNLIDRNIIFG
ncbi:MAG: helix-turn-helix transcriptional regulator [Muribaculaceae bacterium]|nr:helix-turn-helix transcriptional regulator [Muribaculaceae bacterium]